MNNTGLRFGIKLFINQNPSRYWRVNGKKIFPKEREFDMTSITLLSVSSPGEKVFTLRPALHEFALGVTLISAILFFLLILAPVVYTQLKKPAPES